MRGGGGRGWGGGGGGGGVGAEAQKLAEGETCKDAYSAERI